MMKNYSLVSLMIFMFVPSVFAGGLITPPGERREMYPHSLEEVWSASLVVLKGIPLESADKAKGKIRTEKLNWQKTEQKLFVFTSVQDIQAQFFILFEDMGSNKTLVKIFSRQETRKYAGEQSLRSSYLPSNGEQEERFLQALNRQLRQPNHE